MEKSKNEILKEEETFHDNWARRINPDDLCVLQAFEGPVSPEYRFSIDLLGNLNGLKVLNPGCGAGEEAIYLAKNGASVCAVDISSEMLQLGQKVSQKFAVEDKIVFRKMNVENLDLPNESFDFVFGNSILHHVNVKGAISEFHRVLKRDGKAIFIEPLFYNPLINYYRRLAKNVRTPSEHPLKFSDIYLFSRYFKEVKHFEFQFTTLIIFCFFFLIERVHPNRDRYWKKIIREGEKYARIFKILYGVDKILLRLFPFLRRFCWVTVIEAKK
jgi:SAM-dependent methyltransferase